MCEKMAGEFGSAERVPSENLADAPAQLATWIVTAPIWHPLWSQYMIAVISLADFDGHEPAHRQFPEATHELTVLALNPDKGPHDAETVSSANPAPYMTPVNVVQQFVTTDERAIQIGHSLTHAVIDGRLNPETGDAPEAIRETWAMAISVTLDHYIDPTHGRLN